jgi:hypothetical protein
MDLPVTLQLKILFTTLKSMIGRGICDDGNIHPEKYYLLHLL